MEQNGVEGEGEGWGAIFQTRGETIVSYRNQVYLSSFWHNFHVFTSLAFERRYKISDTIVNA